MMIAGKFIFINPLSGMQPNIFYWLARGLKPFTHLSEHRALTPKGMQTTGRMKLKKIGRNCDNALIAKPKRVKIVLVILCGQ